ncbi:hypothetical protein EON66_00985 [archaeon]|nr:MAG: hypothetical protein EON66_00985 [archaeon]
MKTYHLRRTLLGATRRATKRYAHLRVCIHVCACLRGCGIDTVLSKCVCATPLAHSFLQLRNTVERFVKTSRVPAVMVLSEGEEAGDAVSKQSLTRMLGAAVVNHPSVQLLAINPVPDTRMRKVLTDVCLRERVTLPPSLVEALIDAAHGDLRHAVASLEFELLGSTRSSTPLRATATRGSGKTATGAAARGKRSRNDAHAAATVTSADASDGAGKIQNSGFTITGRDSFFDSFHTLGKMLYAKRREDGSGELADDVDELMAASPYDAEVTTAFLAEHSPHFFTSIEEYARVCDVYSQCDVLHAHGHALAFTASHRALTSDGCAAGLAARAVAATNTARAATHFHQLHKPFMYAVHRARSANERWVRDEGLGIGYHLGVDALNAHAADFVRGRDVRSSATRLPTAHTGAQAHTHDASALATGSTLLSARVLALPTHAGVRRVDPMPGAHSVAAAVAARQAPSFSQQPRLQSPVVARRSSAGGGQRDVDALNWAPYWSFSDTRDRMTTIIPCMAAILREASAPWRAKPALLPFEPRVAALLRAASSFSCWQLLPHEVGRNGTATIIGQPASALAALRRRESMAVRSGKRGAEYATIAAHVREDAGIVPLPLDDEDADDAEQPSAAAVLPSSPRSLAGVDLAGLLCGTWEAHAVLNGATLEQAAAQPTLAVASSVGAWRPGFHVSAQAAGVTGAGGCEADEISDF